MDCDERNYSYFEHGADIGVKGAGKTVEESFEAAACAMFSIMADISLLKPMKEVNFKFVERDLGFALVLWLNGLLNQAAVSNLIFCNFKVKRDARVTGEQWSCYAAGDSWREDMEPGVEVKGATLTELSVTVENGVWISGCVVDV